MKIKSLLQQVNKDTFIQDYVGACGVDDVQEYLNPKGKYVDDPIEYENIQKGLKLINELISKRSEDNIYIVQDCDVDGICSATLMYKFLIYIGIHPDRIDVLFHNNKKHGLSDEIMDRICHNMIAYWSFDSKPLIILPDAGTNDKAQCKELVELGCKILVIDHHDREKHNPYATIINNQTSPNIHNKNLSGTGVVWKFITAYCKEYLDNDQFYLDFIDLVNFANLADVMDMRSYENRCIGKWAINIKNPFLKYLCKKHIKDDPINPTTLVWKVVPRLNAVCRLSDKDKHMDIKESVFDAFVYDDVIGEQDFYKEVNKNISSAYNEQKRIVKSLYEKIISTHKPTDNKIEIVTIDNTPYTGLIANKLMEYYNKPILLVHDSNSVLYGSLRSPYPMKDALNKSGLATCQGHEQACGVHWNKDDTEQLIEYCNNLDVQESVIEVCCSYKPHEIPHDIFGAFDEWNYIYATGIPYPQFYVSPIYITNKDIRIMGANNSTIKFTYQGVDYIKFSISQADKKALFIDDNNVDKEIPLEIEVVGKLQVNWWRGKKSEQVLIDHFECREHERTLSELW